MGFVVCIIVVSLKHGVVNLVFKTPYRMHPKNTVELVFNSDPRIGSLR